jgi:hypothetical protein
MLEAYVTHHKKDLIIIRDLILGIGMILKVKAINNPKKKKI